MIDESVLDKVIGDSIWEVAITVRERGHEGVAELLMALAYGFHRNCENVEGMRAGAPPAHRAAGIDARLHLTRNFSLMIRLIARLAPDEQTVRTSVKSSLRTILESEDIFDVIE